MKPNTYRILLFVAAFASVALPLQAEWLSFRGPTSDGMANGDAPISCDEKSIAWEIETPGRGVSSPIVVGDQIIVTASNGVNEDRLHVMSYDVETGKKRWHRQFWATGQTACHPTSANAAPTPASDGKHVVAFFSSNDCVCLGIDGSLKWYRGLGYDSPTARNDVGMASSPMIAEGVVVCQVENQGESFVEALEVANGKTLWKIDRPKRSNWTSPVYLGKDSGLVLLKSDESIAAHELRNGETTWEWEGDTGGIPTTIVKDDLIYVPGSTFVVLKQTTDLPEFVWDSKKIKPDPSPVIDGENIYFINRAGVMNCVNSKTRDNEWQIRLGGKYWASPIMAGDHLYSINDAGKLSIVSKTGEKVAEYEFDGSVLGSPVVSDGALFVRGESKLWKIVN